VDLPVNDEGRLIVVIGHEVGKRPDLEVVAVKV
jgi:hypothetical protein